MRRGYTLVEVLVALTILAAGLAVLIGAQAQSALLTERANRMAIAALLARSKMLDIESELLRDGFQDTTQEMSGDFDDEGVDEMEWEAVIEVVEIPPEAAPEFAASISAQLFGGGDQQGALSGSTAVSQYLPMIVSMVPDLINQMAQRARRVDMTVSWPEGDGVETLTVQYYVVDLVVDENDDYQTGSQDAGNLLQGAGQLPELGAGGGLPGNALQ